MSGYSKVIAQVDRMGPESLRDATDILSRGVYDEAQTLRDAATSVYREALRKMLRVGVREDIAEREAHALADSMREAATALTEAAQQVNTVTDAADVYLQTIYARTGVT